MEGMKLLIVDDEKVNVQILECLLRKAGFSEIETALSGFEAIKLLGVNGEEADKDGSKEVDLIITDLMMPEMSGIEFCREIRKDKRFDNVPVIMITASNNLNDLQNAFEAGVMDYMYKPFRFAEILPRIRSSLRLKKEIDRRIQKESELNELLNSYLIQAAAVGNSPSGVAVIDHTMRILWINQAFLKIIGDNIPDNARKRIHDIPFDKAFLSEVSNYIMNAEFGRIFDKDIDIGIFNGINIIANVKISAVKNTDDDYFRFVFIINDITEKENFKRRVFEELRIAERLQQSLLPHSIHTDHIRITGLYLPEKFLGGDIYYWCKINENKYGVIIIDVMGHGTATSLICMYLRSLLPGIMISSSGTEGVILQLDRYMKDFNTAIAYDFDYYCTALVVVVDTDERRIEYVNAGHPQGLIFRKEGRLEKLDEGCIALGLSYNIAVKKSTISYDQPVRILMFTDGLTDAFERNGADFENSIITKMNMNLPGDSWIQETGDFKRLVEKLDRQDDLSIVMIELSGK